MARLNRRGKAALRQVLMSRRLGEAKKPRKRLPRQIPPRAIEREYARRLVQIAKSLRTALKPLLDELPGLLRGAREARALFYDADLARYDAGESRRIRALMEQIRQRAQLPSGMLEDLAAQFAERVETHQRIQMGKQVRAALGVDVFREAPALQAAIEGFVTENVGYMTDLPRKTLSEIEGIVNRGVSSGQLHGDMAKEINARLKIGETRAKLIARDQVGKFYGAVSKTRNEAMGVKRFIWRTVNDERVRDEHSDLEGTEWSWDNLPSEGYPGEPIQCRCYPEPVFDDLLAGL